MAKTYKNKNGRGIATKGWKKEKPSYHQRTVMLEKCGKKCFLGHNKSFPVCKKNTCRVSRKGVYAAYIRSRQYKHKNISKKANRMLINMGVKR